MNFWVMPACHIIIMACHVHRCSLMITLYFIFIQPIKIFGIIKSKKFKSS